MPLAHTPEQRGEVRGPSIAPRSGVAAAQQHDRREIVSGARQTVEGLSQAVAVPTTTAAAGVGPHQVQAATTCSHLGGPRSHVLGTEYPAAGYRRQLASVLKEVGDGPVQIHGGQGRHGLTLARPSDDIAGTDADRKADRPPGNRQVPVQQGSGTGDDPQLLLLGRGHHNDVTVVQLPPAPGLLLPVDPHQTLREQGLRLAPGIDAAGELQQLPQPNHVPTDADVAHRLIVAGRRRPFIARSKLSFMDT